VVTGIATVLGRDRRVWLLGALAVVAIVIGGCTGGGSGGDVARNGDLAPLIDAPSIVDGERVSSAGFTGKPYLVNFWGAWCEPCKKELPRLVEVHEQGVAIFAVDVRDSSRLARKQLAEVGASWPSASDPDTSIAARWGVVAGFPVTVAVGADGRIRARHLGELSEEQLDELVAKANS